MLSQASIISSSRRPKRPPIWPQEGAQTGGATGHFEHMAPGNPHKAPWVSKRPPMRLPRSHKKPPGSPKEAPKRTEGSPKRAQNDPQDASKQFPKIPRNTHHDIPTNTQEPSDPHPRHGGGMGRRPFDKILEHARRYDHALLEILQLEMGLLQHPGDCWPLPLRQAAGEPAGTNDLSNCFAVHLGLDATWWGGSC